MYLLFLDESGTPPSLEKAGGIYFALAGIAIKIHDLQNIENHINTIKQKFAVDGEVKWKFFGNSPLKKRDCLSHLDYREKDKLRHELFDLVVSKDICASVIHGEEFYKSVPEADVESMYQYAYTDVFRQFNHFLRLNGQYGSINIDHRMNWNDQKLRLKHHELMKNEQGNLIINSVNFIPSELSEGLQLADLIAGAIYRNYQHNDNSFMKKLKLNSNPLALQRGDLTLSSSGLLS